MKNLFSLKKILLLAAKTITTTGLLLAAQVAYSHSVGQVQTTKFFAPETVRMLLERSAANSPGFRIGDSVSYLIQFTPVDNGASVGAGGYITDYIPAGTQVIDAAIVQPNGSGGYSPISPDLPGSIDNGWGNGRNNFLLTPFTTTAFDPTGQCATGVTAGRFAANQCNGSVAQQYADTGIFYSTDPRTAVFTAPNTDGRVRQGCASNTPAGNGYNIAPTAVGNLNGLLGQSCATTHNLWDATQTNAFGSSQGTIDGLAAPKSARGQISSTGRAAAPFGTGSAVAGINSGYPLDDSGNVGPWQRISYMGSRIGSMAGGPAIGASATLNETTANTNAIVGSYTSAGWNLSPSSPLPQGTNAVRWAVGKLVVGQLRYVKITLKLTAVPPVGGIINNSEVFGGDAGDGDDGKDSAWRYHVPSVADNNSNLLVFKKVICVYSGETCLPSDGATVPTNAKVRYNITYLNSGNGTQNNVVLSDTLPAQATQAGNARVVSGLNILPTVPAISTTPTLTNIAGSSTITFQSISALDGGAGGSVEMDVQTNAGAGTQLSNRAKLVSSAIPAGVTSFAVSNVVNTAFLTIAKSTSTPVVSSGGTATYTITITNTGAAAASNINVYDFLPTTGGSANPATRFSYASPGSFTGLTAVTPSTPVPPTLSPYSANANQQQVLWSFAGQTLAAGATASITFNATVGASVPASATAFTNDARVVYNSGIDDITAAAPVVVMSGLTVNKTIDCIYFGAICNPYSGGGLIPTGAKLRYRIAYQNNSTATQTNVVISDSLPTQTVAVSVSNPVVVSGSNILPTAPALASISAGGTFAFQTIPALAAGAGGAITFDVQTNATSGASVTNSAKIISAEIPGGMTSQAMATAYNAPILAITKTATPANVLANGLVTYTINVTNTGTGAASGVKIFDFLPHSGTTLNLAARFNYTTTNTISGLTTVSPATQIGPGIAPYSANLNQQQVLWDFTGQNLAPGATATIVFVAAVGNAMPAPATYTNSAQVQYTGGAADAANTAPVNLITPLSLSKTIDCVYSGATCVPYTGGVVSPNAKLRYRLAYQNVGDTAQTNVVLSDTLPAQTAAASVSNMVVVSGANILPTTPVLASITAGGTFTFATIPNLAIGAGGAMTFDVQTNAASGAVVTNNARIISTALPVGATSNASVTALAVPILQMTKTVTPSGISAGGSATYTLTVTNTSTIPATQIKIYDFLPTSGGTTSDATKRFAFGNPTSITGLIAVTPTTSVPPTISPYSVNANQQEVLWDFGAQTLAAGASFNIVFTAVAGTAMPGGVNYTNVAQVISNSPSVVTASASVPIALGALLTGRVFEDINYGGGSGRACGATAGSPTCSSTSGAIGRTGTRVELYDSIGNFIRATTTDANGDYTFGGLATANYTVRVVNNTVTSSRTGYLAGLLPVQTFRINGLTGTVGTADTNRVGGENPCATDAGANTTNATLASLTSGAGTGVCAGQPALTPESITTVTVGTSNLSAIDFGFNFDTIVNTKDSGQGSLRQFILNSNALGGEASLAQSGSRVDLITGAVSTLPAGKETSIFMVSSGTAVAGLRAGLSNQLTGGVAIISPTTNLVQIIGVNASNTVIDGGTQTANVGNSNNTTLGAGGVVGVDNLALAQVNGPEVQIQEGAAGLTVGLDIQASNITVRATSLLGFGTGALDGNIRVGTDATSAFTGTVIEQNVLGTAANNFTTGATIGTSGSNIAVVGADNGIVRNNLIGLADRFGVIIHSTANGWVISSNEVRNNDLAVPASDGISIESGSGGAVISGNLVINNKGTGIDGFAGAGSNTIVNNTVQGNGTGSVVDPVLENAGIRVIGANSVIDRNIITANAGDGVMVASGSTGNIITKNSIYTNGQIGIDLLTSTDNIKIATDPYVSSNDGVTVAATGNNGIDYPVFTVATLGSGNLAVSGFVGSAAGQAAFANATIEIFKADNAPANQNGEVIIGDAKSVPHGEGRIYLGTITADANGNFNNAAIAGVSGLAVGDTITATARLAGIGTSEFSANFTVVLLGVNVSGFVYSDPNQNSVKDVTENGSGLTLYAKLVPAVSPNGPALVAVAVNPATGAYSFGGVAVGQYTIVIDINPTLSDVTPSLPPGAIGTEIPTQVRTPIVVGTTDVTNLNFGLVLTAGITGRVFNDSGTSGGIANNGVQEGGELGISGVSIKLTNADGSVTYATTVTDTNGNYSLVVPTTLPAGTILKVVETNLSGFTSTGGQAGNTSGAYSVATDATTFTLVANSVYTNVNFSDVPNNTFTPNGAQSSLPGTAVLYPHTFTAGTAGTVLFTSINMATPATTGWNTLIYQDANCNGVIDTAEANALVTAPIAVIAGQTVCIVVKENIPANAPYNAQDQITVNAQFSYANAPSLTVPPLVRQDITTIGNASGTGLVLQKAVRNITAGTPIGTSNQGKSNDLLEYIVSYSNNSAGTLTNVVINDTTPAFTSFQSATCGAPIVCTIAPAPAVGVGGAIQWKLDAPVAAGATGTVTFTVRIQ